MQRVRLLGGDAHIPDADLLPVFFAAHLRQPVEKVQPVPGNVDLGKDFDAEAVRVRHEGAHFVLAVLPEDGALVERGDGFRHDRVALGVEQVHVQHGIFRPCQQDDLFADVLHGHILAREVYQIAAVRKLGIVLRLAAGNGKGVPFPFGEGDQRRGGVAEGKLRGVAYLYAVFADGKGIIVAFPLLCRRLAGAQAPFFG